MFSCHVTKQAVLHSHQSTGNVENNWYSVKHWANLNFLCLWDLRTPGTCFNMTMQWGFLLGRLKFLSAILTSATTGKWISYAETTCGPYTFLLTVRPSLHFHPLTWFWAGIWSASCTACKQHTKVHFEHPFFRSSSFKYPVILKRQHGYEASPVLPAFGLPFLGCGRLLWDKDSRLWILVLPSVMLLLVLHWKTFLQCKWSGQQKFPCYGKAWLVYATAAATKAVAALGRMAPSYKTSACLDKASQRHGNLQTYSE